MGGTHTSTNQLSMGLLSILGSKKTLVGIIILLVCVILYLTLSQQQSTLVCKDSTSQESRADLCTCPSVNFEQRDNTDTKMVIEDSSCHRGTQRQFPQAIIIGVRKAGTRALINMLKTHPDIFAALGEVHFFDRDENFEKGIQWYIEKMPCTKGGQITIEKSPSYFTTEAVPMRIKTFSRHVKLLLIVRNPIDRAVSDFIQINGRHSDSSSISGEAFERLAFNSVTGAVKEDYNAILHSLYDKYFQQWLKYFSVDQILVLNGDTLISNPVIELQKAEKFLEVKNVFQEDMFYFNETKGFYCWKKSSKKRDDVPYCLGEGKGRQHPHLTDTARAKLKKYFQPHNENFYLLTHQNFGWDSE